MNAPQPPITRKTDLVENHFGVEVADPYRWLEDADSEETRVWVNAQNEVTFGYLRSLSSWSKIINRLQDLVDYERYGVPTIVGTKIAYTKNAGTQNQAVLMVGEFDGTRERILLNPNTLSDDGTVALNEISFSPDGNWLAYSISKGGSDWQEWRVRNVESSEDLADFIPRSKFTTASWSHDNRGFYYGTFDAPAEGSELQAVNRFQKVYFHELGTDANLDRLVFENPEKGDYSFRVSETEDGKYQVVSQREGTRRENRLHVRPLNNPEEEYKPIADKFDGYYGLIGNDDDRFYVLTDFGASGRQIVEIDLNHPEPENWRTIVPERKETIVNSSLFGDVLIVQYLQDAKSVIERFDLTGKSLGKVDLPGLGTAFGFGGKRHDPETFFSFSSYILPSTIYRLNLASLVCEVFKAPDVRFDPTQFETRQAFYPSKDGTLIPMFITHRKGIELDGSNPTLMYGYGGFGIPLLPGFSIFNLMWMELGGIYAVCNLRGGSEYGSDWYDAGKLQNKQNVFDDFIAGAEYLIENGYTSTPKIAISGGSNGGLLVGACETQKPGLFGACVPSVGVMDMLRFHKFTIGYAWKSDYGDPEVEDDFKVLMRYSPLHNLKKGTPYPAILILTCDHDDRVVPAHSYKFAAALQEAQVGQAPILIRIETSAGHGAGKPLKKQLEESTDVLAFLAEKLKM